jgi:hypothetical protein
LLRNSKTGLVLALLCAGGMGFYVNRILVPYQRADAALHQRPRGNLSDLYPRWLGARELLLRQRNPYSREVTREIQVGYYGRELDPARAEDPKDQQGFVYPVYVAFFLAPTVGLPFEHVRSIFGWLLVIVTAFSVPMWLRVTGWRPPVLTVLILVTLTLGSFSAVQGFKLQQLSLVVAALLAAACVLFVRGHLALAGMFLAVSSIKPQLALPITLALLLWTAAGWKSRQRLFWGFAIPLTLLLAGGEFLLPGWMGKFLSATRDYRQYAGQLSMLDLLLTPLWGKLITLIVVAAVVMVWLRVLQQESDSPALSLAVALTLAVTVVIIPMTAPYNYLLLLPAIFWLLREWSVLWRSGNLERAGLLLASVVIAWQWVAALGLCIASVLVPAARVQQAWWLPLYTSAKIPIPVVCLFPLSALIVSVWRQPGARVA